MRTIGLLLVTTLALTHSGKLDQPESAAEPISVNDNRVAAGALKDGVLTVNLEVRRGSWFPDGPNNPSVEVHAFAEAGKALQVPGPLLRVTEGTEIRATIRNALDSTVIVHGLYTRDGTARALQDTIRIAAGAAREVSFQAGRPGTYYYWGTTTGVPSWTLPHHRDDSQLSGALIVDPRGTSGSARDRVLMLGFWLDRLPQGEVTDATPVVTRFVINGRVWPHTERLSHALGDTIQWRVINATFAVHPMHLHGFYFRVHSRGSEDVDSIFPSAAPPDIAVTERLAPGRTAVMSWTPERAGNWLFHCHDNVHITPSRPFDGSAPARPARVHNHSEQLMGGLVLAVEVKSTAIAVKASDADRRRLRLIARADTSGTAAEPAFGFVLQGDPRVTATAPAQAGPTVVLKRSEPVAITVVNQLPEHTAVHWHGIELESYFDGVPDFAGMPGSLAPAIAPRDSFEVRFTPPRAGTFIYHTHVDEVRQQRAGLAGALLVLEPGERYDPTTDLVMLISTPTLNADRAFVMLNGTTKPQPLDMQAGKRYRIRVINIHTYRPSLRVELKRDSTVLTWRALAKDGAALPPERATERRSALLIGNGETYDFAFTPATTGALKLEVLRGNGLHILTLPLNVR